MGRASVILLILLAGCVDVITVVPDVSDLPTITKYEIIELFDTYGVHGLAPLSFGRGEYSIPLVEDVRKAQELAFTIIGKSPYDGRDRNCVDFANALLPQLTWTFPSAPIGIVFYLDFVCSVPGCRLKSIVGHALLVMVTQERELVFIEPRINGRIYEFDRDVIITEVRMGPKR